jgi:photosystem II stability/assembly factor-like uncharacterized protein
MIVAALTGSDCRLLREVEMPKNYAIMVGTSGTGIWRSTDGGEHFHWVNWRMNGIACNDIVVRRFFVDPFNPKHVIVGTGIFDSGLPYLGTRYGLHESVNSGGNWVPLPAFEGIECWRVAFDPTRSGRFFVGTRPANIYLTEDAGASFRKLDTGMPQVCRGIGLPRITNIALHPQNPDIIFASVEIGGVFRSLDGGKSWDRVMQNIRVPPPEGNLYGVDGRTDCHFVDFLPGEQVRVMVSTPDGPFVSDDLGENWESLPIDWVFPHQYHREFIVKLDDPNTIFYGVGDDTAGKAGSLLRSRDRGRSWEKVDLPGKQNSTVYSFAQHPADPNFILACTLKGQLYGTEDGGETWTKYDWEFAEVRGIGWAPV